MATIELTRYRILQGKSERVNEWMAMLNRRLDECLATFEREQMYIELIFRESMGGEEFLYWFSIQGEGGESVNTSQHDLDLECLKFWHECMDRTYNAPHRRVDMELQVTMIPRFLMEMMKPVYLRQGNLV